MRLFAALCLSLCAAPLGAHPHVFVNTGLVFVVDGANHLTHVKVTWEYDELYSLLITEDMGVDRDYDGVLNTQDIATLTGFDMNWIEGYNGDLVGSIDGTALTLSGPTEPTATMQDGKITTTHLRRIEGAPVVQGPVTFSPYDGSFYSAYDVELPVQVEGRTDCDIAVDVPDAQALALTKAEVAALPEDFDMEAAGLGNIGERFATKVTLTCETQ
ncbi:MAG: DUF1007 family protein [Sulfitobacter sp.]